MPNIEIEQQCPSCEGKGLYSGMAERDGFAVVCSKCGGSGRYVFRYNYEPFTGRKPSPGVIRVLECNPGFCVGVNGKDGQRFSFDYFGGITKEQWESGAKFPIGSEMRHSCPRWWWQCAGAPREHEPKQEDFGCGWGSFSSCKNFPNKSECWRKWDEQRGVKP